jgi:hypothetical protein
MANRTILKNSVNESRESNNMQEIQQAETALKSLIIQSLKKPSLSR